MLIVKNEHHHSPSKKIYFPTSNYLVYLTQNFESCNSELLKLSNKFVPNENFSFSHDTKVLK